jgi:hypothetical protein
LIENRFPARFFGAHYAPFYCIWNFSHPSLIRFANLADVWRMNENLTNRAGHRISGKPVHVGWVPNPFAGSGQHGGFSDGFLTRDVSMPVILDNPKNPVTQRIL